MNISAGILLFRERAGVLEVLLAHPGGPFYANKDDGAWSVPKGLVEAGEDLLAAAQREFAEEIGFAPQGPFLPIGSVKLPSGKLVHAWAARGDFDPSRLRSNTFTLEWPRGSGQRQEFPEIDRAEWFSLEAAHAKLAPAQRPFLRNLQRALNP
jgi:predicted NUDIX family NTP pyrophosphohydrolase